MHKQKKKYQIYNFSKSYSFHTLQYFEGYICILKCRIWPMKDVTLVQQMLIVLFGYFVFFVGVVFSLG